MLADDPAVIVSLTAIFFVFGFPVICWFSVRWLAHRERMEMIRQGFDPRVSSKDAYRAWQQAAPGPVRGPAADEKGCGYEYDYGGAGFANPAAQVALRNAVVIVAVGLALTIGLSFIGFDGGRFTPGPWLLGGLVPLFVGLAQVFSALAAGASFQPHARGPQYFWQAPPGVAPPDGGTVPPPSGATSPGSYTYRPGVTPELRPPTPPVQRDN